MFVFSRDVAQNIANVALNNSGNLIELLDSIATSAEADKKTGVALHVKKFKLFIETGKPQFSIFAKRNSKVPYLCFSSMPFYSCPGMGACEHYCYSVKAWRYPAGFFHQLQNEMLIRTIRGQRLIQSDLLRLLNTRKYSKAIMQGKKIDLRLYVDGDFGSMKTLRFWMQDVLPNFPMINAYGYSKSWELLIQYGKRFQWPDNYVLNISNGSKYDDDEQVKSDVMALPVTRHEFLAIPVTGAKKMTQKQKIHAIHAAYGTKRVFTCPGKCGNCTSKGHACGNPEFKVPVAIPTH